MNRGSPTGTRTRPRSLTTTPSQDPATVATELFDAAGIVADTYANVPTDAWSRRGLRSNGSEFTVATIAIYHLHDIAHHAYDVSR